MSPPLTSSTTHLARRATSLGLAFGLTAAIGIVGISAVAVFIYFLRRRHKARKLLGLTRVTQDESGMYCLCPLCSGCKRKRGGGDGSARCWNCEGETCKGMVGREGGVVVAGSTT
ncbi:hypothetical protein EJ02DRAFT_470895 [Clathrospora elynae]|uniref:Uncharacterized protein n=1 Tax=Clathrospora elynae TaxID=706981 RepID=A0A6A5SEJ2_9PLEO|nr:hypothetical protein EJ02DRAFT_470895 [Clathrospora elynae]